MMKTKDMLAMALLPALGVLTACSSDDAQTADRVPITLTGTTLTVEETRAAAGSDLNDGYIEAGQTVKVLVRNTNGTDDDWKDYIYTSAANGVLTPPSTPPFYPLDNTNVDIVAFSPSFASSMFSVLSDQTTNDSYLASDLVYASATNKEKSVTAVPLQFEHKMAKIVVNVTAGKGVSEIRSVTLASIYPQVSFNASTGVVGSATGIKTPVTIVNNNTTATVSGTAVIPGQTVVGDLLTIVTDQGTATYSVSSKTFTAGDVYTLNIRVKLTDINAETSITEWTDNSTVYIGTGEATGSPFLTFTVGGVKFEMLFVEGTDDNISMVWGNYNYANTDSPNQRTITVQGLSDFYIGQTEVTNGLWNAVMGSKPSGQKNSNNSYPVAMVSWNDICNVSTGFLARLNAEAADQLPVGMKFQLISEAQWYYAAKGGKHSRGYTYAGSNTIGDVAWYKDNSSTTTHPVATKPANELGLYDMSGSVWEWCMDWYADVSANQVFPKDYVNTTTATYFVCHGGTWSGNATRCTFYFRGYCSPDEGRNDIGFRLVLQ